MYILWYERPSTSYRKADMFVFHFGQDDSITTTKIPRLLDAANTPNNGKSIVTAPAND